LAAPQLGIQFRGTRRHRRWSFGLILARFWLKLADRLDLAASRRQTDTGHPAARHHQRLPELTDFPIESIFCEV
jgi:hypothetical protein